MIDAAGNTVLSQMLDPMPQRTGTLIRRITILPGRVEIPRRVAVGNACCWLERCRT